MLKIVPGCLVPELIEKVYRFHVQYNCQPGMKGEGNMRVRVDSGKESLFLRQVTSACKP